MCVTWHSKSTIFWNFCNLEIPALGHHYPGIWDWRKRLGSCYLESWNCKGQLPPKLECHSAVCMQSDLSSLYLRRFSVATDSIWLSERIRCHCRCWYRQQRYYQTCWRMHRWLFIILSLCNCSCLSRPQDGCMCQLWSNIMFYCQYSMVCFQVYL